jgi:putative ABC transport system permease protein
MVLAESCIITVAGALAGVLPGLLTASALGAYVAASQGVAPTLIQTDAALVALSVLRVVAFGAAVALYPAWKATRVPIVDALASRA